jgi:hypothetical protein
MNSSTLSSDAVPSASVSHGRRALRALGFVAFSFVVIVMAGEVLERISSLNPNLPKIREMIALEHDTNAVIYLGDSTTLDSVNPVEVEAALGLRGYNMSSGGQKLIEDEMLLRHYLQHNAKPRLVALGLFINLNDSTLELNPEIYFGLPGELRDLMWHKAKQQRTPNTTLSFKLLNWFKAYRYRTITPYVLDYLLKRLSHESRANELVRGHLALDYSKRQLPITAADRSVVELNEPALDSFLDFCEQQQLPVLLFEPPGTPGFSAVTSGRDASLAAIAQRVRTRKHVSFRSFNDAQSLPYAPDEWSGQNHLNRKGAIRFTRDQLVPYIRDELAALPAR